MIKEIVFIFHFCSLIFSGCLPGLGDELNGIELIGISERKMDLNN